MGPWPSPPVRSHSIHYSANALFSSFGRNMSVRPHARLKSMLGSSPDQGQVGGAFQAQN